MDRNGGVVRSTADPQFRSRPNIVTARMIDNKGRVNEHSVTFNPHDERAARMANSLKSLDVDDLGRFLSISAKITRYFAAISTQYNPVFGVINLTRDVQAALLSLTSTPLGGSQSQILKDTFSALRGIYTDARAIRRSQHPESSWAQLWEEFQMPVLDRKSVV